MIPYSLYLHIPFCQQRCNYCDFNTYAGQETLIPTYMRALEREIRYLATGVGETIAVHTIYFGGGTPSLLPPEEISRILQVLSAAFALDPATEITLEANPGTLSPGYLRDLRSLGVNRLSVGMQSSCPAELALLGRRHTYRDVVEAVNWARKAGFDNLSLDLIFGFPAQTLEHWDTSLTLALGLAPDHFSLYALTLEAGTPMQRRVARGLLPEPDSDLSAEMYELACDKLAQAGYIQYEISNWAKPSRVDHRASNIKQPSSFLGLQSPISNLQFACLHNLQYWRNLPYLGFGAGAHGFANGIRTANVLAPAEYIHCLSPHHSPRSPGAQPTMAAIRHSPSTAIRHSPLAIDFPCTPATKTTLPIDQEAEMGETMMMGLRLTQEGVSRTAFQTRFNCTLEDVFGQEIGELVEWELLEWVGDTLRLTPKGRLLGNQVFMRFV